MYYVYVLKNNKGRHYIGFTSDLKRRFKEHNSEKYNKNRFTFRNRPWKLVYYEAYSVKEKAMERERKLKQYGNSFSILKKRIM